jgi:hypothetical protein
VDVVQPGVYQQDTREIEPMPARLQDAVAARLVDPMTKPPARGSVWAFVRIGLNQQRRKHVESGCDYV